MLNIIKKLNLHILLAAVLVPTLAYAYDSEYEVAPDYPGLASRVQSALADAKKALNVYVAASRPENPNSEDMVKYLGYFKSWYQSVKPAPVELYDKINSSQAATAYINELKRIAQQFKKEPTPGMSGASSLSADGVTFYQYVIDMAQKRLIDYPKAKSDALSVRTMQVPVLETRLA